MARLSIATRITLIVFSAVLAAWMLSLALYYRSLDGPREPVSPSPAQLAAMAKLMETGSGQPRDLMLKALSNDLTQVHLTPPGELVATASDSVSPDDLRQAYRLELGERPFSILSNAGKRSHWPFLKAFTANVETLTMRVGLATGENLVVETRRARLLTPMGLPVGLGAGLIGTVIALVALVLMHRATRPLVRLAAALDSVDLSGDPKPLPVSRTYAPEIRALINAYGRLQGRLSQLLRARMVLLGGISHDVRSFATRLRLRVEHIPEGQHRDKAIADIASMIRLLDDAMLTSRTGAGELAQELVELDEVLQLEVEDRQAAGAAADLRVLPAARGATVLGDRLALRRVVANLIDNAVAYGRAAHLTLSATSDVVILVVTDEGTGIPEEMRDLLFEPFTRAEASRSRRTGGAGLGLAVVRALVEGHDGTVVLDEAPGGGARFTVTLPRFRPQVFGLQPKGMISGR